MKLMIDEDSLGSKPPEKWLYLYLYNLSLTYENKISF